MVRKKKVKEEAFFERSNGTSSKEGVVAPVPKGALSRGKKENLKKDETTLKAEMSSFV